MGNHRLKRLKGGTEAKCCEGESKMKLEEIERNSRIFRNTAITYNINEKFCQAMDTCDAGHPEQAEMLLLTILAECPNDMNSIHYLSLIYDEQGREIEAVVTARFEPRAS